MKETETDFALRWLNLVTQAALVFEARWTMAALKRVNPEVHGRLREQRSLFDQAVVTGTRAEVERHGAAMVRGWAKAVSVLEHAAEPDDAYWLGQDPGTGFRVAISYQKAAVERVRQRHGPAVVWVTPDEVAAVLAKLKPLAAVKQKFPGAEVVEVRQ
jgi:hypothetical protein